MQINTAKSDILTNLKGYHSDKFIYKTGLMTKRELTILGINFCGQFYESHSSWIITNVKTQIHYWKTGFSGN